MTLYKGSGGGGTQGRGSGPAIRHGFASRGADGADGADRRHGAAACHSQRRRGDDAGGGADDDRAGQRASSDRGDGGEPRCRLRACRAGGGDQGGDVSVHPLRAALRPCRRCQPEFRRVRPAARRRSHFQR